MSIPRLVNAMNYIDDDLVSGAARSVKKKSTAGWYSQAAIAACICLVLLGGVLLGQLRPPADPVPTITGEEVDPTQDHLVSTPTVLYLTTIDIDGWETYYKQVSTDSDKLEQMIGEGYPTADQRTWYHLAGSVDRNYLIERDEDGSLVLWEFLAFVVDEGETYTYGDVLRIIYGVESPEDITSITTTPFKNNGTDLGKAIQEKVGTRTYTDEEDIAVFFDIVWDVVCYGMDSGPKADDTRFTYSFSTAAPDKLTSGESTYGTRCIEITFADGSTLDSWKYSALSGSFFEYNGINTDPLEESDVYALNAIFGIE